MKLLINNGKVDKIFFDIRGRLLSELKAHGCEVLLTGMNNGGLKEAEEWNLRYYDFNNAITGINPFTDIKLILSYIKFIKENGIDIVHSYTAKANIYGSIAAWLAGVRRIYPVINGLGYVFTEHSYKTKLVRAAMLVLYKAAFFCSTRVFFQNSDDALEMQKRGIITVEKCVVIPGSGIDVTRYSLQPQRNEHIFLLASRLLYTKGVIDYCKAARIVKAKYPNICCALAGSFEYGQDGVKKEELDGFIADGSVKFLGYVDMMKALAGCSVFVHPAYYREGVPHAVLEAMSTGRAIITCNTPGCRETIKGIDVQVGGVNATGRDIDITGLDEENTVNNFMTIGRGKNGFLIESQNCQMLAEKMLWMIEHPEEVKIMGIESRKYAEERFDVEKVNRVILEAMEIG